MACGILDPQPGTEPSWAQGCESTKSSPLDHQGIPKDHCFKATDFGVICYAVVMAHQIREHTGAQ